MKSKLIAVFAVALFCLVAIIVGYFRKRRGPFLESEKFRTSNLVHYLFIIFIHLYLLFSVVAMVCVFIYFQNSFVTIFSAVVLNLISVVLIVYYFGWYSNKYWSKGLLFYRNIGGGGGNRLDLHRLLFISSMAIWILCMMFSVSVLF
ncbi:MAG: hypothetical protein WC516_01410 [Patescibacteria group bacterium]